LTHLNLSWNLIRSPGAKALANALVSNTSLRDLDLGFNLLRSSGAGLLAPALAASRSLEHLSLRRNELGPDGATQLADAIRENKSLRSLNLGLNGIAALGAAKLGDALMQNSSLEHLNLDWNALRQLGLLLLANGLRNRCGLTFLDLSYNKLSHEGTGSLATALKKLALTRQQAHDEARGRALAAFRGTAAAPSCGAPVLALTEGAGRCSTSWPGSAGREPQDPSLQTQHVPARHASKLEAVAPLAPGSNAMPWSGEQALGIAPTYAAAAADDLSDGATAHDDASDSEDAVGCAQMAAGSAAEVEIRQESLPLVILKGNSLGVEGLAAVLSALRPDASGCLDLSDNELGDTGCHLLAQQGESRPLLAILNAFLESCVAVVSD
jgi:hypothetical protein